MWTVEAFPLAEEELIIQSSVLKAFKQKHPPFYLFLFPWSVLTPATHQESFTKYIKIKYKKNIHTFVQCALEHITDLSDLFKNGIGNRLNKGVGSKMFVWGI